MGDTANSKLAGPIVLLGRILFSIVFVLSSIDHFDGHDLAYATAAHIPLASIAVPIAGVMILVGGLSVLFGYRAKLGALLIIIFLIPVTPMMHNFWAVTDPRMHEVHEVNFLKNLSMLGAAFLMTQFGAGPWSLDARKTSSSASAIAKS
ncbi:MAG: DoxX family protein [Acidobacteriota bacterium]|nr:DoxX family protein [Acidobacteriota bacterium]